MTTISVHIVTYNSAATIDACLEAVVNQQDVDFQVRVLDNHSDDDTVARVKKAGIAVHESDRNLGYAAAHNLLIDQTDSTYVLTLNPDVRLMPGFLAAMQSALNQAPEAGSAAGLLLRVDHLGQTPSQIDSAGVFMRRSRRQGLLGEAQPPDAFPLTQRPIFGPDGAAAFYRREMLEDIRIWGEVFDSDFFMHKEDIDVCWRAQLRGWSSIFVPNAIAHHIRAFRPGQRGRVSAMMRCLGVRNRYLLMIKNESPAHFWRDLPFIAAYDAGIIAYLLLRERESLAAFRSLAALRRRMVEKRRLIQSGRRVDWRALSAWFTA